MQEGTAELGRSRFSRRIALGRAATAGAIAAIALNAGVAAAGTVQSSGLKRKSGTNVTDATPAAAGGAPTVVLVHGAFADGSCWYGVIEQLQAAGIPVKVPANPLRGVSFDSAYVASVINQIPGPVLLVGHSYGGVVISVAAAQASNVIGLVYVAAFMPDEGETVLGLLEQYPPTLLGPALRPAAYPSGGAEPGTEFTIAEDLYHEAFAADLPVEQTTVLATFQRPASAVGFGEPVPAVAWKTLPSWYALATADQAVGVELERFFANRAGSVTVEIDASHSVMVSQPGAIADLIKTALGSLA